MAYSPTTDTNNNENVTLGTKLAGEDLTNDVIKVENRFISSTPLTASSVIKGSTGRFAGFLCSVSSSGVIRFWDNTSATGTKIIDSFSVSTGQVVQIPGGCMTFTTGLYLEVVSGTCTITSFYN